MPRTFAHRANHNYAGIPASIYIKQKFPTNTYDLCAFLGLLDERQVASNVFVDQHRDYIAIRRCGFQLRRREANENTADGYHNCLSQPCLSGQKSSNL